MDQTAPVLEQPFIERIENPRSLLSLKRFDIPVKWRYFRHLIDGNDPDAEQVYLWHIDCRRKSGLVDKSKQTPDDYLLAAKDLLESMGWQGFDKDYPIPIDPNGELLGGAHRLACAIALDIPVFVQHCQQPAWAPSWGFRWFWLNKLPKADRKRLVDDWEALCRSEK